MSLTVKTFTSLNSSWNTAFDGHSATPDNSLSPVEWLMPSLTLSTVKRCYFSSVISTIKSQWNHLDMGKEDLLIWELWCIMANSLCSEDSEFAEWLYAATNDKHWKDRICTVVSRIQLSAILCVLGIALPLSRLILMCSDLHYMLQFICLCNNTFKKIRKHLIKAPFNFCDFFRF